MEPVVKLLKATRILDLSLYMNDCGDAGISKVTLHNSVSYTSIHDQRLTKRKLSI